MYFFLFYNLAAFLTAVFVLVAHTYMEVSQEEIILFQNPVTTLKKISLDKMLIYIYTHKYKWNL